MGRPDLIRSWAMDIAGCFAPDYVWHDLAQVWQTPGQGEDAVAVIASLPAADRASMFESLGMTPEVAAAVASASDETMGRCILSLYRSAAQPAMARLGDGLGAAATRPGLVIIPTEDQYTGGEARARWSARRAKAEVAVLPGARSLVDDPGPGRWRGCVEEVLGLTDTSFVTAPPTFQPFFRSRLAMSFFEATLRYASSHTTSISLQSIPPSRRTPSHPRPPTYGGRKNRSGSVATSSPWEPGGAAHQK
jgi:hypothetical protein